MTKYLLTSACIFIAVVSLSQQFNHDTLMHWQEKPVLYDVIDSFKTESAVAILDERKVQYKKEGSDVFMYSNYHKIIKINDDKGIEMFNKIYVPLYYNGEVQDIKARTITADGKVYDLTDDKIKEIEEDERKYKLFAMDAVEKGSEVEYRYTIKRPLSLFGTEIFQDDRVPVQEEHFTLMSPSYLRFNAKGYNGFNISRDSVMGEERIITGYAKNVVTIDDEKYALPDKYLKRVEYKFSYNVSTNPDVRLYTWKEFAQKTFSIYTTRTNKEEKAVDNLVSKMNVQAGADEPQKILALENYIKTNFNIDKRLIGEDKDDIEQIIRNKACNDNGALRLFSAALDKLGISYEVVFPSNRGSYPLDEELENWNRTDDILLYFPGTGKYISPMSVELRYPYVSPMLTNSKALFLKPVTTGTVKTAVDSFGEVKMEPFDQHAINMEADLHFSETLDTLYINSKQILKGYGATSYRPIYVFLPKDKQDEANKDIIKAVGGGSTDISNVHVENTALTDYFDNKPLIISADIKSTELLENAGNKILLKIGEVIGPQEQMYQEKPRRLPVELPFPHVLQRTIRLNIPEGYKIKNLKDAEFDIKHAEGNEVTMGFTSTTEQDGQHVEIKIMEIYKNVTYPLSQFEEFKKVINASADFNKVVLVLERK
jgi:hypothetical protein